MSRKSNGVALVGRILGRAASGEPCKAADLARELDAARTTIFSVLHDLEAAGLVDRDARGLVSPGAVSGALGFACFGLGSLAGAVEALLPVLRDETDARAQLVVREAGQDIVLAQRSPAGWAPLGSIEGRGTDILQAELNVERRGVILRLHLGMHLGALEREAAQVSLDAVASALSRPADPDPNSGCDS